MFKKVTLRQILHLAILCCILIPTQASDGNNVLSLCNGKPDGTILNNVDSCTSYTFCANQNGITVFCPSGWGFSAQSSSCVQYAQSDCSMAAEASEIVSTLENVSLLSGDSSISDWLICAKEEDGTLLPIEDDCQAYIYCLSRIPMKVPCLFGMGYNSDVGGCVLYKNSDCVDKNLPSVSTPPSFIVSTTKATCDNEQRPENQEACVGQAFGALVPYPGDCAKFLVCNCEYPTVKDCAAGTWFDSNIGNCNYPQAVDCPWSGGSTSTEMNAESTTAEPTSSTSGGNEWGEDCDTPEGMSSDICLKYNDGFLIRYPYNCNAYINCTNGCPVMDYCLPGTVFNALLKICDTPDTAQCEELPLPTTTEPTTTEESTTPTPESTIPTTKPMTTTAEPTSSTSGGNEWGEDCDTPEGMSSDICLKYNDGFLIRYPYNCNAYINCTNGCPVMDYCLPDKVFNAFLKICDTPDTAQCEELPLPTTTEATTTITTEEPTTEDTTEETTVTTEETTTVTEESTSATEESTVTTEDATEGSTMTTEETTTVTEESTNTTEESTITTEESTITTPGICIYPAGINHNICAYEDGAVLSYPYNCTAFIRCEGDCPVLEYCDSGKIFNSFWGICDNAEDVECIEQPYPTPGTPEPTTDDWSTTESSTTGPPFSTTLPPSVDPELCQGQNDYTVYPYEGNCGEYLMCLNGNVQLRECPNGWLFNADLKMCDDAEEEVCYTASTTTEAPETTENPEDIYDLCLGQPVGTTFPYIEDCRKYYYCLDGGRYYLLSCTNNNYYDPSVGNCGLEVSPTACQIPITTTTLAPETTTTLSPEEKCTGQEFGTSFPYEENCQQYIMCTTNGGYKIMNCPAGNYYYPDAGDCGPSSDVDICRKSSTTTTTSTATTTTTPTPTTTLQPTPSPVQGICGNYTNGELIDYPDNCHKYISCVLPIPIGFYCPNNLYFDESQQICVTQVPTGSDCADLPSNGTTIAPPTNICQDLSAGDTEIYPSDCQMYFECLGAGNYMLQVCNQGEYFNPLQGSCSAEVGHNYCKQDFDTTTPTPATTTTAKPQGICYDKPSGYKVSYPNDCFKYIVCEWPIPTAYTCTSGLQFSTIEQECVEPIDSDCGIPTTTPATTEEPLPTMPDNECTGMPDFTLLPYEEDCSMFIVCIKDLEHFAYCNEGEYFDITLDVCSGLANAGSCIYDNSTTTTIMDSTTTTEMTTTTTTTAATTTTTTTTSTTPDPNLGPCDFKPDGTKVPYPGNCEKYIECQEPIAVGYDCPEGLEFSAELGECVRAELANCSIKTTTEATTTTTTTTTTEKPYDVCESMPSGVTIMYPEDCSKYYQCLNDEATLESCLPNSYYNPISGQCDSTSPTFCHNPIPGPCYDEPNGFTYTYDKDCSKYYLCLNGMSYVTNCQANTYYNPDTAECDRETSSTTCLEGEGTTEMDTTTTAKIETTTEMYTTTTDIDTTTTVEEPMTTTEIVSTTTEPQTTTTEIVSTTTEPQTTTTQIASTTTGPQTTTAEIASTTTGPQTTTTDITETTTEGLLPSGNICCNQAYGARLPYPGDDTKYVICLYPVPEVASCPANSQYDPSIEQCREDDGFVYMPTCANLSYGQAMVYEGDCTKYYICFGTEAMIMNCSDGWYFNADLGSCVPQELYTCPW